MSAKQVHELDNLSDDNFGESKKSSKENGHTNDSNLSHKGGVQAIGKVQNRYTIIKYL